MASDRTYQPLIHRDQGGNVQTIESGGVIDALSGAAINCAEATLNAQPTIPLATLAAGGTALANAAAIVRDGYVRVINADDTAAVKLPASVAGKVVKIKNTVANKILIVFPPASSQINAKGVNNAYNMAAGSVRTFQCFNSVLWVTDPETIA